MKPTELGFITVGRILAPWGIEGKLKVEVETDFPQRFAPSSLVYVKHLPMTIKSSQWHKGKAVIKLNTIDSIEAARPLQGQAIEIRRDQVYPLPDGQYYRFQIIGLKVKTTAGESLGTISEILSTESNDNYIVRQINREILIPAIDDVVKSIDLDKGEMLIEPIDGLLTLNQKGG